MTSGFYLADVDFTNSAGQVQSVDTVVHVYDNLTSTGSIVLTQADFNFHAYLFSLSFEFPAQPGGLGTALDLGFASTPSLVYGSTGTLVVNAPTTGMVSDGYKWAVNGQLMSAITSTLTINATDAALKPGVINRLSLTVLSASDNARYAIDIPFMVAPSPFASGDGGEFPYVIVNQAQLAMISSYPSANFVLASDISLTGSWTPITGFSGSFDGSGRTISGLTVNLGAAAPAGLFASISGTQADPAIIRNLRIEEATVSNTVASTNLGILAGEATWANFLGCFASGAVANSGGGAAGGLVGRATDSNFADCGVWKGTGTQVTSAAGAVGGLVGYSLGSSFTRCFAQAAVQGATSVPTDAAAGLVGLLEYDTTNNLPSGNSIQYSYATGEATGYYAGGLVGYVTNFPGPDGVVISNCYATGAATGEWAASLAGGTSDTFGKINYCYAVGPVFPQQTIASPIVGQDSAGWVYTFCNWDSTTTGITVTGPSGTNFYDSGSMSQSSYYTGWDFATVWTIQEGNSYPYFKWQGTVNVPYVVGWNLQLLSNTSYESGDATGWTLNTSLVPAAGTGTSTWGLTAYSHSGSYALQGSYVWCTKTLTLDLWQYGYTAALLAGPTRTIRFSEYVAGSSGPSNYYMRITILAPDGSTVLADKYLNDADQANPNIIAANAIWSEQTLYWINTGGLSNIRYVRIESGSKDTLSFSGNYGAVLDDAALIVYATAP